MLHQGKRLPAPWDTLLDDGLRHLLDARHALAEEAMREARDDTETKQEGSGAELSDDPVDGDGAPDTDAVQARACELTFAAWSDADWIAFDEADFEDRDDL